MFVQQPCGIHKDWNFAFFVRFFALWNRDQDFIFRWNFVPNFIVFVWETFLESDKLINVRIIIIQPIYLNHTKQRQTNSSNYPHPYPLSITNIHYPLHIHYTLYIIHMHYPHPLFISIIHIHHPLYIIHNRYHHLTLSNAQQPYPSFIIHYQLKHYNYYHPYWVSFPMIILYIIWIQFNLLGICTTLL